jgi:hypothetical protein
MSDSTWLPGFPAKIFLGKGSAGCFEEASPPNGKEIEAVSYIAERQFYRTSHGYIGVGPKSLKVGDQVWMICDSQFPHVLRPAAEEWKYILMGEAYLHSCMQDEMVTEELEKRMGPV